MTKTRKRFMGFGFLLAAVLGIAGVAYWWQMPKIPDDTEFLRLLYGPEITIQTEADGETIFITEQLSETEKEQFQYANQVNTNIAHTLRNWVGDPKKLIVFTRTGLPDCCDRSLSPVLGAALLTWDGRAWQVDSYRKWLISFERFDLLPQAETIKIGPGRNALVITNEPFQTRGTQTQDIILAVIDGHLKPVAMIETLTNNAYVCPPVADTEPCWETRATYEFLHEDQPEYFDLRVVIEGTKLVNNALVDVSETIHYVFANGAFQQVD